jgi:FdhE protein
MTAATDSGWAQRIARAAELEERVPAAAELLRFYRAIARFQSQPGTPEALRKLVQHEGPAALAEAARNRVEPAESFIERVLRQAQAIRETCSKPARSDLAAGVTQSNCPFCSEPPLMAVLRPAGDGGKRYLVCSLCLSEWEFRRMLCPHCGEENHERLPIYTTEEFPHIRVEACHSCRHYLKAVDLTIDGRAAPIVDELASVVLDLWAAEKGYIKISANLLEI